LVFPFLKTDLKQHMDSIGVSPLDAPTRAAFAAALESLGRQGQRVVSRRRRVGIAGRHGTSSAPGLLSRRAESDAITEAGKSFLTTGL
jgi:hypothetical protein